MKYMSDDQPPEKETGETDIEPPIASAQDTQYTSKDLKEEPEPIQVRIIETRKSRWTRFIVICKKSAVVLGIVALLVSLWTTHLDRQLSREERIQSKKEREKSEFRNLYQNVVNRRYNGKKLESAISEILANGYSVAGFDFSECWLPNITCLAGQNLYMVNLSESELHGATLIGANLDKALMINVILDEADLSAANLYQASLTGANLYRCNLTHAYLFKASLSNVTLNGARLMNADLSFATLSSAQIMGADLSNANLFRADLTNVKLYSSNLSQALLSEAVLRDADLNNANLTDALLNGTDLSGANFSGAILTGANLSNADISGAIFTDAELTGTDFSGTGLLGTNLIEQLRANGNMPPATNPPTFKATCNGSEKNGSEKRKNGSEYQSKRK